MLNESIGHGNDLIMAQFVFLFLFWAILPNKLHRQKLSMLLWKTNRLHFSMAYTYDHRNDVKMIKPLQWNHSTAVRGFTTKFEHVDLISMVDKSIDHGRL